MSIQELALALIEMKKFYCGKNDQLQCRSYRGIRLIEHALKIFEKVVEKRLRQTLKIDIQFGFMCGRSTTDAIFFFLHLRSKVYWNELSFFPILVANDSAVCGSYLQLFDNMGFDI